MSAELTFKTTEGSDSVQTESANDKYIISVVGTQKVDDESDSIELTTTAAYVQRGGRRLIRYREYLEEQPGTYLTTLISIDSDKRVLIQKNMDKRSELILEEGVRHQCAYFTPIGSMMIGVYTDVVNIDLGDDGGKIEIEYTLDFNSGVESENKIEIELTKKENSNV